MEHLTKGLKLKRSKMFTGKKKINQIAFFKKFVTYHDLHA